MARAQARPAASPSRGARYMARASTRPCLEPDRMTPVRRPSVALSTPPSPRASRPTSPAPSDGPSDGPSETPSDDNLLQWTAKLTFDTDCNLGRGLDAAKQRGGQGHVELGVEFPERYPLEPPKVRVVSPRLHHGNVLDGAVCIDMLSAAWSPV